MSDESKEQLVQLKKEAKEHDEAAVGAHKNLRESRWVMAEHLAAIKENNLQRYIGKGFAEFDDYRAAREIGRTTCFQSIRFWNNLSPYIARTKLFKLTKEAASQLCRLPIDWRKKAEVIDKALSMTDEDFTAFVDKICAKIVKDDGEGSISESRVPFKVMMYMSQKGFITGVCKDIIKDEKLDEDDIAKALEVGLAGYIAASLKDSDKLLQYLIPDIRAIVEKIDNSEDSADITLDRVKSMLAQAFLTVTGKKDSPKQIALKAGAGPVAVN